MRDHIKYDDIGTLEDQILGMALTRGETYRVIAELDEAGFDARSFSKPHRTELLKQLKLHANDVAKRGGVVPDNASFCEYLHSRGLSDAVGGLSYVCALADLTSSLYNVAYYAERITVHAAQRGLIAEAQELLKQAREGQVDPDTLALDFSKRIAEVGSLVNHDHAETGEDLASSVLWHVHNPGQSTPTYPTGLPDLDNLLGGGIGLTRLYIVAGRPKNGKSALGINIAAGFCRQGHRVHLDSLEMSSTKDAAPGHDQRQPGDLALKLAAMESGVGVGAIQRGKRGMSAAAYQAVRRASFCLSEWPITIDDTASRHYNQLFAGIRRRKARYPDLKLVVVDYAGLIEGDKGDKRRIIMGEVSRGLKRLAKDLNIAVILIAQVNRECEKRADKRPIASDLKESGDLEQDADGIIVVQRPSVYRDLCVETPEMWIRLDLHRHGDPGEVCLMFDGPTQRIEGPAVDDPLKREPTHRKGNDQW